MIIKPSMFAVTIALVGACKSGAPEPNFKRKAEAPAQAAEPTPASQAALAHAEPGEPAPDLQVAAEPSAEEPRADPTRAGEPSVPEPTPAVAEKPVLTRKPTSPDPLAGKFTLAQATAGLPKKGQLTATIETGYGALRCKLYDDKAPQTVANFVGLARGLRPFWDERAAKWVKRPMYDGTSFHRVIADFMIQGGDQLGDGSGGVGYEIPDELAPGLSHDRAGLLCMANRGPNTNGGQFFITDGAAPHLTQMKSYTIFGECEPLDVVAKIARAPRAQQGGETPDPAVPITRVQIARK